MFLAQYSTLLWIYSFVGHGTRHQKSTTRPRGYHPFVARRLFSSVGPPALELSRPSGITPVSIHPPKSPLVPRLLYGEGASAPPVRPPSFCIRSRDASVRARPYSLTSSSIMSLFSVGFSLRPGGVCLLCGWRWFVLNGRKQRLPHQRSITITSGGVELGFPVGVEAGRLIIRVRVRVKVRVRVRSRVGG